MVISSMSNRGPSEIVFFDLETTVPTKSGQRFCVVEFGAIVVCARKLVELDSYCTLIRPRDLSNIVTNSGRSDGITRDKVTRAPTFEEVADKIFSILDGRIWGGHNIRRFDCVRIKEAFAEINRPAPVPNGMVDSLGLLTEKFGRRAGNMKMATLASYFGLGQQKHRSLEDVRLNLEVLKHCATVLLLESSIPRSIVDQQWCSVATRSKSSLGSSCSANIRGKSIKRKSGPSTRASPYARETSCGKACSKFHPMENLNVGSGNEAGGFGKSRSALGDVTNRLGKRGFSEREKSGGKSSTSNDEDIVKHVRVELNLFNGDVLSRISEASTENNKGLNVRDSDSCAFSQRSIDIEAELTCVHGNSEEINGDNSVKLCEKKAESPSVSPMFSVENGSLNTLGDMPSSALTMRDNIGSRKCKDHPSFADLEIGRAIDSKAGGGLPFGYKMLEIPEAVNENTSSNLTGTARSNVVDVASRVNKASRSSYLNQLDLGRDNAFQCANIKAKYNLGDVSANNLSTVSDTGSDWLPVCDAGEVNVNSEGTQKNCINYLNEVEGHTAENLITSQSDSIDCAIFPDSQESKIFGFEKSSGSKKCKEYHCSGGGVDAIKACSCSFCTKAAYIWLDLNYQDIRGRVSAMRKIQKEASILGEISRMIKDAEKHDAEGFAGISKLEIDLMHQWKFLFQHMAGVWEQEGDRLETSLSPLTDLREKCKRDLGSD
ncbi:hypothetical protein F511_00015 [Dorcoceras hygrometricum]|nr:hypothetical protein F511_00015 [Dorcoceras hygrometricum]